MPNVYAMLGFTALALASPIPKHSLHKVVTPLDRPSIDRRPIGSYLDEVLLLLLHYSQNSKHHQKPSPSRAPIPLLMAPPPSLPQLRPSSVYRKIRNGIPAPSHLDCKTVFPTVSMTLRIPFLVWNPKPLEAKEPNESRLVSISGQ